ncbi:MAG: hypothetical protein GXP39_13655 [Chloroflexi bacterium]|nr:hypothetical protein [Chloroflexota bacterium]
MSKGSYPHNPSKGDLLKHGALAVFIEAIGNCCQPWGPRLAVLGTIVKEIMEIMDARGSAPETARRAIAELADMYQERLRREMARHAQATTEVALTEAIDVLNDLGLTDDDLARRAGLDADKAARIVLDSARDRLSLLNWEEKDLTQRLVKAYYEGYLRHRDTLTRVGIPAFLLLLERLPDIERRLVEVLDSDRNKTWRYVRWPVRDYDRALGLHPIALLPEYCPVCYVGTRHRAALEDLLAWTRRLAEREIGQRLGLRLYVGSSGAGKTRLLIEAGKVLRREGWIVGFLADGVVTEKNVYHLLDKDQPTLLILDHAGVRSSEVEDLLCAMAEHRHRTDPFILILLNRIEPRWFKDTINPGRDFRYVDLPRLLDLSTVEKTAIRIPILPDIDRILLFQEAVRCFQEITTLQVVSTVPIPTSVPENPRFVLLLALLALAEKDTDNTIDKEMILNFVWQQERDEWIHQLKKEGLPEVLRDDALKFVEEVCALKILGRPLETREEILTILNKRFPYRIDPKNQAIIINVIRSHTHFNIPEPLASYIINRVHTLDI